jgi:hypothetical protein
VNDLVDACAFAKAGLRELLTGKNTRSDAWTMDIFVRDVCDALRHAGVRVSMNQDSNASHAQSLAVAIGKAVGLPSQGTLFKQMQRAKRIKKKQLPDVRIEGVIMREPDRGS